MTSKSENSNTPLFPLSKNETVMVFFTGFYILAFTISFLMRGNYEFILYVVVVLFFFGLILATVRKTSLNTLALWGLSAWGLLHMAGGGVKIAGDVLYNFTLIPIAGVGDFSIFKYDQFVHCVGFGVATYVLYLLLLPYLNERTNWKVVYAILIAGGMGLGALNEIIEFIAVITIQNVNVGGYANTALDLVFNMFGAIIAVCLIHSSRKNQKRKTPFKIRDLDIRKTKRKTS